MHKAMVVVLVLMWACSDSADLPSAPAGMGPGDAPASGDGDVGDGDGGDGDGPALPPGDGDGALDPSGGLVQDRCFAGTCEPVALPDQPDLMFLEDMGDGWQRLMEAEWALSAGTEGYRCQTFTVPEDIFIAAFFPQSPTGTHHATFGIESRASGPDQVVSCGVGAGGERRLHGSGAGSEPFELPAGVAMRLNKGEQITMNLHLFNPSEARLTGRSGMWVKTVSTDAVENEADAMLAGPLNLSIPGGRSTQGGQCTLTGDVTIYGVAPHMHQLGVHMEVFAETAAGERLIYDGDYDFNEQLFYEIEPLQLSAGDRVRVACTYENDTGRTVGWGDSSLEEMCFASLGLYPAIHSGGLPCFN